MITYTFNSVTKFLLILAPLIIVSGCATIADPGNPASQTAANIQAEPAPERLVRYCRRMAETNNLRIAIGICERALAAAPENPEPVIILAEAYLEAEHPAEAAEAYRFALSIDDQSGEAHFGLGKLYLRDSRLEEARPHLEAALRNGKQDPAIFNALGVLEDQSGNHDSAQALYEAGLELDPNNTALANNYGVSVLLSKSTEIGDKSFGQPLLPEQNLSESRSRTELPQKSISVAEKRILPLNLPRQAAVSNVKKAEVQTTSAVPALMQTPEESLFSFFVDSQSSDPSTLHPVITPAPVEIVDFQALETLPVPAVAQVPEKAEAEPLLARALLDYNPLQTSRQVKPTLVASPVPEMASPISTTDVPSIDLATVHPGRNPFFQPKTKMASKLNSQSVPNDPAPTSPGSKLQVAEIPHLPIEGPRFDDIPQTGTQNGAMPADLAPKTNLEGTPVQADLLIFDAHDPVQAAIMTAAPIPGHATDANFSNVTTGLSLLQYNEEMESTFDSYNAGPNLVAIHHEGITAPSESGAQSDAEPGSNEPKTEPLLWPSSLADLYLPPKRVPLPDQSREPVLAMMLLNRSGLSTV